MTATRRILVGLGLGLGLATGLFLGDRAAFFRVPADGYIRLLQMTVLPYVTVSLVASIGSLDAICLTAERGSFQALYDHWILGRDAKAKAPRWSILRNVLHWER